MQSDGLGPVAKGAELDYRVLSRREQAKHDYGVKRPGAGGIDQAAVRPGVILPWPDGNFSSLVKFPRL